MATTQELKARACARIERQKDEIVAISDHIMRHPEPGYREVRTAEFVAGRFGRMGLECREGLALAGVKARFRGRSPGPAVAVLGELDSLIVAEHPLADPATHAAHACGHNAQVASMIGAGMGLRAIMGPRAGGRQPRQCDGDDRGRPALRRGPRGAAGQGGGGAEALARGVPRPGPALRVVRGCCT